MAESPEIRHRRKMLERILKNWQAWGSLVESQGLMTITVEGEEYHYFDMLEGLNSLPPRQRQAVFYMCIQDKSEAEVAKIMGFENENCTPVQQYKSFGLTRFLQYLDATPEEQEELKNKVKKYGRNGPRKKKAKAIS